MQRVVINMQSFIFSDAIKRALKNDGDFNVTVVSDPRQIADQCRLIAANLVLMEVTNYTLWKLEERMKIRDELRRTIPDCKIVLFVDEKMEKKTAAQIKQAKRDGLIDQFVFASSSTDFMVALLDTM